MTLRNADRDSARVTAVIHSMDQAGLPAPTVESVAVNDNSADVCLIGHNGIRATVRLQKKAGRWQVVTVEAA